MVLVLEGAAGDVRRRGDFEPRHALEPGSDYPARANMSHDAARPRRPVPQGSAGRRGRGVPAAGEEVGLDEVVDVAVQDLLDVPPLGTGAMVLHERVGLQDVGADLTAKIDVLLGTLLGLALLVALAKLQVVQAGP